MSGGRVSGMVASHAACAFPWGLRAGAGRGAGGSCKHLAWGGPGAGLGDTGPRLAVPPPPPPDKPRAAPSPMPRRGRPAAPSTGTRAGSRREACGTPFPRSREPREATEEPRTERGKRWGGRWGGGPRAPIFLRNWGSRFGGGPSGQRRLRRGRSPSGCS